MIPKSSSGDIERPIPYLLISFIRISKIRTLIMKKLKTRPFFPSELVRILNTSFPSVSRNLKKLEEKELVICQTPNQKRGKIYSLTEKGRILLEEIENQGFESYG